MSTNLIAYHGQCTDGFTAAWSAWKAFNGHADYVPVCYGEPMPDTRGRHVYMLDYCPHDEAEVRRIACEAASLTIIDHHADKEAMLGRLRADAASGLIGHVEVIYNGDHSGASLAWAYFNRGVKEPELVRYVEDQDLCRWSLPRSQKYNAALQSFAHDFDQWDLACGTPFDRMAADGAVILRYKDRLVERAVAQAVEVEVDGHKVLVANTPLLMPEVAAALAKGRPFGMAWMVRADGLRQASLRSEGDLDVSKVAKSFGGGGHVHCAGFETAWHSWPHGGEA